MQEFDSDDDCKVLYLEHVGHDEDNSNNIHNDSIDDSPHKSRKLKRRNSSIPRRLVQTIDDDYDNFNKYKSKPSRFPFRKPFRAFPDYKSDIPESLTKYHLSEDKNLFDDNTINNEFSPDDDDTRQTNSGFDLSSYRSQYLEKRDISSKENLDTYPSSSSRILHSDLSIDNRAVSSLYDVTDSNNRQYHNNHNHNQKILDTSSSSSTTTIISSNRNNASATSLLSKNLKSNNLVSSSVSSISTSTLQEQSNCKTDKNTSTFSTSTKLSASASTSISLLNSLDRPSHWSSSTRSSFPINKKSKKSSTTTSSRNTSRTATATATATTRTGRNNRMSLPTSTNTSSSRVQSLSLHHPSTSASHLSFQPTWLPPPSSSSFSNQNQKGRDQMSSSNMSMNMNDNDNDADHMGEEEREGECDALPTFAPDKSITNTNTNTNTTPSKPFLLLEGRSVNSTKQHSTASNTRPPPSSYFDSPAPFPSTAATTVYSPTSTSRKNKNVKSGPLKQRFQKVMRQMESDRNRLLSFGSTSTSTTNENNPLLDNLRGRASHWMDVSVVHIMEDTLSFMTAVLYIHNVKYKNNNKEYDRNHDYEEEYENSQLHSSNNSRLKSNSFVNSFFKPIKHGGTQGILQCGMQLRIYDFFVLSSETFHASSDENIAHLPVLICTHLCEPYPSHLPELHTPPPFM